MAGFTDRAFRDLCKRHGADVVLTEFVQSDALLRNVPRVWRSIALGKEQRPAGVQIFGARPDSMARAATLVVERLRPDFIDINCGCPARNVVEQNAGAGLMREPLLAEQITKAVVAAAGAAGLPVTAKIRLGWDTQSINAVEFAKRLAGAGVAAISVHGRTRSQGYSGSADWNAIGRVAAAVAPLPVVGNGDIRDATGALRRWRESGVAGLMVGRGALGNPWLFAEIRAALRGEPPPAPPNAAARLTAMRELAAALAATRPDAPDIRWLLPRLLPFIHSAAGARKTRAALSSCRTLADLEALTAECAGGGAGEASAGQ